MNFKSQDYSDSQKEFNSGLQAAMQESVRRKCKILEEQLVKGIEEMEGRVPSNEEVASNGRCLIFPDGNYLYTYKGKAICGIRDGEIVVPK